MGKYRTYIYVDGFNLYYRAVRGTAYKWLDLKKLLSHLLSPKNEIIKIKYFTALVSGQIDPNKPIRQKTYIRALQRHIPEIEVYYGHFLSHEIDAPLASTSPLKFARVIKIEEKGSDVNLAVHLLNDAWLDNYDCAVVVSNDSDLAEAFKLIRAQTNKSIGLITPVNDPSKELMEHSTFIKRIRKGVLSVSQLPNPIPNTTIYKPAEW